MKKAERHMCRSAFFFVQGMNFPAPIPPVSPLPAGKGGHKKFAKIFSIKRFWREVIMCGKRRHCVMPFVPQFAAYAAFAERVNLRELKM